MAIKNKDTLRSDLLIDFVDNKVGAISEEVLRNQQADIIDSLESLFAKGQPLGYAPLNATGQIALEYLPASVKTGADYKGVWSAENNIPEIEDGEGSNGDYYRCIDNGSQNLGSGLIEFFLGDIVVYDETLGVWDRVNRTDSVTTVNSKSGDVVLNADDLDETINRIWYTTQEQIKLANIEENSTGDMTPAEVKFAYESNPNTNPFTNNQKNKLDGIEDGATADQLAGDVPYDNTSSGLTGENVQLAIDELRDLIDTNGIGSLPANKITYNNNSSGLFSENVQTALDELVIVINNVNVNGGLF